LVHGSRIDNGSIRDMGWNFISYEQEVIERSDYKRFWCSPTKSRT
jgi:hypothetical protein